MLAVDLGLRLFDDFHVVRCHEHILFEDISIISSEYHSYSSSLFTDDNWLRACTRLGGDLLVWVWRHVWQEMGLLGNWVACFLLLRESGSLNMSGLTQHASELVVAVVYTVMHALLRDRFSLKQWIRTLSLSLSMVSRSHQRYESAINLMDPRWSKMIQDDPRWSKMIQDDQSTSH